MHVLAPAKINLHLRVGKRRDDGFHPLISWMCTIGLFDSLSFERSSPLSAPREIALRSDAADLPCGADNLICRAAAALGIGSSEPLGIDAFLKKSIPSGAGLGGGSSDAARTLLALNRLGNLGLPLSELSRRAANIGSDVPFFLHAPSAICRGRGERIETVLPPRSGWVLLILPAIHCPTADVYRQFDRMGLGSENLEDKSWPEKNSWQSWSKMPSPDFMSQLVNDLEAPAFALFPQLAHLRERASINLNRPVRMSGSGSSLFTLFDGRDECESARASLSGFLEARALSIPLCPVVTDDLNLE